MATLYLILLSLHSLNRWLVILTAIWALIVNMSGLSGKRKYLAKDRRPVVVFTATAHLQLVLGLLLFAHQGMQNIPTFPDAPKASFKWEHLAFGLLAAVFATLASAISKRASTPAGKYRATISWTLMTLICVLLLIPWWRPLLRFFS